MANFTQETRPMAVTTPLGKDVLLMVGFTGREGISQLFDFQLDLVAENQTDISFDKVLGQKVAIGLKLPGDKERHFSGICSRLSQGHRDETFTHYRMEVVPQLWLLTRRMQSRIFQHLSVPDILKKVLEGLDVSYEIMGTFHPRDFCVQYRETDFDFASRLMEEEGIYYFFKHTADGHKMVVANTPQSHPDLPENKVIYEEAKGGIREEMRIHTWEKTQELRSGKYTLWDHCFELPHKHLEAEKTILDSVPVGAVTHKLKVGNNDKLEIYDYPGAYAQRFDGIDKGGAPKPADLQKIFEDNKRTVEIRMQQEALPSLKIQGAGNCRQFMAGHKFTLERHFNGDGQYVLTTVEHTGSLSVDYRSGEGGEFVYENKFTCIPVALPFRPPLVTEKPVVEGPQTAVVVGPPGEIIFCDKYGRIKVQFHWDRHGKNDADSSCWIRVSNNWGGAGWGGMFLPHVGHEVIVDFEEGDPDRPLITGRVYNAQCMPPMELPKHKTCSAIRDHGGNEIICEGHGKVQQIAIFSPHSNTKLVMGNKSNPPPGFALSTDANETKSVGINQLFSIGSNSTGKVGANRKMSVGGSEKLVVMGSQTETIAGKSTLAVGGKRREGIGGAHSIANPKMTTTTAGKYTVTAGSKLTESSPKVNLLAGSKFLANSGGKMDVKASGKLNQQSGADMNVKSGAALKMQSDAVMSMKSGAAMKQDASGDLSLKAGGDIKAKGAVIKLSSPTKIKGTTLTVD
jgi:type VI secretion system secreted protein VgrG